MLLRPRYLAEANALLRQFPVVALLGARQVGKTTLAHSLVEGADARWFALERANDARALENAPLALEPARGLVVIDEVQRAPQLFPLLRTLADRPDAPARFLVLGSASPSLARQGWESLAGRIAFLPVDGFDLEEVGADRWRTLWVRGGFPRSFLAEDEGASVLWRSQFIDTFLMRDLAELGITLPGPTLRRFWSMLAHWHGQLWNGAELGRNFGVAHTTVRRYLDALEGAFVVRVLPPWHENIGKRQVRSPKVYVADPGLLHALLGIDDEAALLGHPKVGASWEGFALGQVARHLRARPHECFFWATQGGAELDLLVVRGRQRRGFEFKLSASPTRTASMSIARRDLRLDSLDVVYAGAGAWPLAPGVRAVGIESLGEVVPPL